MVTTKQSPQPAKSGCHEPLNPAMGTLNLFFAGGRFEGPTEINGFITCPNQLEGPNSSLHI